MAFFLCNASTYSLYPDILPESSDYPDTKTSELRISNNFSSFFDKKKILTFIACCQMPKLFFLAQKQTISTVKQIFADTSSVSIIQEKQKRD